LSFCFKAGHGPLSSLLAFSNALGSIDGSRLALGWGRP
jgi:hypothetical protein